MMVMGGVHCDQLRFDFLELIVHYAKEGTNICSARILKEKVATLTRTQEMLPSSVELDVSTWIIRRTTGLPVLRLYMDYGQSGLDARAIW